MPGPGSCVERGTREKPGGGGGGVTENVKSL